VLQEHTQLQWLCERICHMVFLGQGRPPGVMEDWAYPYQ
jgi:hypothetical protein